MNKKEAIVSIVALSFLVIGIVSNIYVYSHQIEKGDFITIGNKKLYINDIFEKCNIKSIEVKKSIKENYSGAILSDIINVSGIKNPEIHKYTIVGSDGYQKTVEWNDMEKGILTKNKRVIFSHLPGAFWVRDVVKIEVI